MSNNIAEIEGGVTLRGANAHVSPRLWHALIKELREVRAELEALKASASRQAEAADIFAEELERKFTCPDGYRVALLHDE